MGPRVLMNGQHSLIAASISAGWTNEVSTRTEKPPSLYPASLPGFAHQQDRSDWAPQVSL